jgi:diguanylate cyclase (GGDEF)-like protein
MPLTAALPRAARIAIQAVGLLLVAATAALAVNNLGLLGTDRLDGFFNDWVYNGVEAAAAGLVLVRALTIRSERIAWLMLAFGITAYLAGDIYYTLVIEQLANPPSPSPADVGYLLFYPAAYAMIALLVRSRRNDAHASVWLDGGIGGLAVAAFGSAIVLQPVIRSTHGSLASVTTNLAYPCADLLLLAFVITVFASTGWRPGRTWLLVGLGFVTLAIADSIYLFRVAEGSWRADTALEAMWPAGMVILSFAAWAQPHVRAERRFDGMATIALPCLFALMALFLLIRSNYVHLDLISESLATAALLAAGVRFALTFNDVRKLSAARDRDAHTDDLTGLANRRYFYTRLGRAIAGCRASGASFALLMIDLDHFKELNDTLGHYAGDLLLQQIGPRVAGVVRSGEAIARLGGDEFALILRDADAAQVVAGRIHAALAQPFDVEDLSVSVQASIGIALFPADAQSTETLLRRADIAMYQAKAAHSRFATYTATGDRHSRERLALASELKRAIASDELVVYYQPQMDLGACSVYGVEALVRWQHPQRGLLGPDEFIAVAEQGGLMRELTSTVLERALEQQRVWLDAGRELTMAVNVSATNFLDSRFVTDLQERLQRWGTPPQALRLEITESVLIAEGPRTRSVIDALAALHVKLSLDDFGTGYAPLAYLRELPVNEIKIDRSFISAMVNDEDTATIVASLITLAGRLGLAVVAEGIETSEQCELLRSFGCPLGQGYHFSRPLPIAQLDDWLELQDLGGAPPALVAGSALRGRSLERGPALPPRLRSL